MATLFTRLAAQALGMPSPIKPVLNSGFNRMFTRKDSEFQQLGVEHNFMPFTQNQPLLNADQPLFTEAAISENYPILKDSNRNYSVHAEPTPAEIKDNNTTSTSRHALTSLKSNHIDPLYEQKSDKKIQTLTPAAIIPDKIDQPKKSINSAKDLQAAHIKKTAVDETENNEKSNTAELPPAFSQTTSEQPTRLITTNQKITHSNKQALIRQEAEESRLITSNHDKEPPDHIAPAVLNNKTSLEHHPAKITQKPTTQKIGVNEKRDSKELQPGHRQTPSQITSGETDNIATNNSEHTTKEASGNEKLRAKKLTTTSEPHSSSIRAAKYSRATYKKTKQPTGKKEQQIISVSLTPENSSDKAAKGIINSVQALNIIPTAATTEKKTAKSQKEKTLVKKLNSPIIKMDEANLFPKSRFQNQLSEQKIFQTYQRNPALKGTITSVAEKQSTAAEQKIEKRNSPQSTSQSSIQPSTLLPTVSKTKNETSNQTTAAQQLKTIRVHIGRLKVKAGEKKAMPKKTAKKLSQRSASVVSLIDYLNQYSGERV